MEKFFKNIKEQLDNNEACVMATIIASKGSVPRGAGARMLSNRFDWIDGTIGGGAAEFLTINQSKEAVNSHKSYTYPYTLRANKVEDIGMICGGDIDIRFSYIGVNDENKKIIQNILDMYEKKISSWLLVGIGEEHTNEVCEISVCDDEGKIYGFASGNIDKSLLSDKPKIITHEGREYYIERIISSDIVYIIGGGHVAQALVPVLANLDFRTVVIENREEFCHPSLFKGVEKTVLVDYNDIFSDIDIKSGDYICIMTRGHKDDAITEYQAVKSEAGYVGVIGSKRKVASVRARLMEKGVTKEELDRVDSPIGLEIKAETPAEIAISIAARLIMERASRS